MSKKKKRDVAWVICKDMQHLNIDSIHNIISDLLDWNIL